MTRRGWLFAERDTQTASSGPQRLRGRAVPPGGDSPSSVPMIAQWARFGQIIAVVPRQSPRLLVPSRDGDAAPARTVDLK